MKILIFEYFTGGGLATEPLPTNLLPTGEAMVNAQLNDLAGKPVKVLRDRRLPPPAAFRKHQRAELIAISDNRAEDFDSNWRTALSWADAVWVTAPETILVPLSVQVLAAGKKLLGSHPQAVALAGDKLATLHALTLAGVACVPAWQLADFTGQVLPPWVVKPRDGVGCEGVALIENCSDLEAFPRDWLLQPFIAGEPISLSAIFAAEKAVLLSANRQRVREENSRFHLLGCEVNAFPNFDYRWQEVCSQIAYVIPGLWGYAGIDLILTENGAFVLEVNPRLTLSYAGLSRALGEPIGSWIVDFAEGKISLEEIAYRRGKLIGQSVWVSA